ncbi:MAG: hypothetical protein O2782_20435 [bacterium]|nr:hypothetical protein [bacterium]
MGEGIITVALIEDNRLVREGITAFGGQAVPGAAALLFLAAAWWLALGNE